jgi:lauroyl/myristoyl acyltransferase
MGHRHHPSANAFVARESDLRDRRLGGVWTRRQTLKNFLIAGAVRLAFQATDLAPQAFLLSFGRTLGRLLRAISPGALERATEHAARCMPREKAAFVAQRCFDRAGQNLAISALLRRPNVRALDWVAIPTEAFDCLTGALREGRGAVFVGAHLGPFEFLAAAVSELGLRPAIVVRESYDPRLDPWIDRHRHSRGVDVIHRGAPGASIRIVRALRASQPVGFLPDLGGRVPQLAVNFLGRHVGFPVGPQRIAQRFGAPIVVGILRPLGDGAHAVPSHPQFALSLQRVDTAGTLLEVTQRVASALESEILNAPEDFPWMAPSLSGSSSRWPEESRWRSGLTPAFPRRGTLGLRGEKEKG